MVSYNLNAQVSISWGDDYIKIMGPKGIILKKKSNFSLAIKNLKLYLWSVENSKKEAAYLSWIHQMIVGVTKGYSKKLRLVGVGYRALLDKEKIIFKLGYSHEVNFTIPEDVSMMPSKAKGTLLLIKGIELGRVNQIASEIRGLREPDVYKGKGVQYYNEILKLKKGKREGK